jgi:hypothetical protein
VCARLSLFLTNVRVLNPFHTFLVIHYSKTLQTISLLAYLRESRGVCGPHLVVVPKSVVGNWLREFNKWCPCIRAIKMGGTQAQRTKFVEQDLPLDGDGKRTVRNTIVETDMLLRFAVLSHDDLTLNI